jgi:cytidyltransferase-like protein
VGERRKNILDKVVYPYAQEGSGLIKLYTEALTSYAVVEELGSITGEKGYDVVAETLAAHFANHRENILPRELIETQSIGEYLGNRELIFEQYVQEVGNSYAGMLNKEVLFRLMLDFSGFLVGKESDLIGNSDRWGEYSDKQKAAKLVIEDERERLFSPYYSQIKPAEKILSGGMEEAVELIHGYRKDGIRTVMVIGGFDYAHSGHGELVEEANVVAGNFGRVIAFVTSDKHIQVIKGEGRPYLDQEERVNRLALMQSTHHVCPLEGDEDSLEEVIRFFDRLHKLTTPHFRVAGEKDDKYFDTYAQQCREASIVFIHSNRKRGISSTSIGKVIT